MNAKKKAMKFYEEMYGKISNHKNMFNTIDIALKEQAKEYELKIKRTIQILEEFSLVHNSSCEFCNDNIKRVMEQGKKLKEVWDLKNEQERDIKDEDFEAVEKAVKLLKGVIGVKRNVANSKDYYNRTKIWDVRENKGYIIFEDVYK